MSTCTAAFIFARRAGSGGRNLCRIVGRILIWERDDPGSILWWMVIFMLFCHFLSASSPGDMETLFFLMEHEIEAEGRTHAQRRSFSMGIFWVAQILLWDTQWNTLREYSTKVKKAEKSWKSWTGDLRVISRHHNNYSNGARNSMAP